MASLPATVKRPKFYTVEEANARLPLVRSVLRSVTELSLELKSLHERLILLQTDGALEPAEEREIAKLSAALDVKQAEMLGYVKELAAVGAVLKDDFMGLVDFPAWLDGREICLCYKYGEDEIAHWHDVDAGYGGRRPLPNPRARGSR